MNVCVCVWVKNRIKYEQLWSTLLLRMPSGIIYYVNVVVDDNDFDYYYHHHHHHHTKHRFDYPWKRIYEFSFCFSMETTYTIISWWISHCSILMWCIIWWCCIVNRIDIKTCCRISCLRKWSCCCGQFTC